jgi:hypothetical protein
MRQLELAPIQNISPFHLLISYAIFTAFLCPSLYLLTRAHCAIPIAKPVWTACAPPWRCYMPRVYLPITWLFACMVSLAAAHAQSTFGSIRGTVQDDSGAVIPGAMVTVHSLDENFDRQVSTDDSGNFVVENLKAGRYSLTAHHEGALRCTLSDSKDNQLMTQLPLNNRATTTSPLGALASRRTCNKTAPATSLLAAPVRRW